MEFLVPYFKESKMKKITWVDLFQMLCDKANKLENVGKFDWNKEIGLFDEDNETVRFESSNSLRNNE